MKGIVHKKRGCGHEKGHGRGERGSNQSQNRENKSQDYNQGWDSERDRWWRSNQGRYDKSNIEYCICHKFGHYSW